MVRRALEGDVHGDLDAVSPGGGDEMLKIHRAASESWPPA